MKHLESDSAAVHSSTQEANNILPLDVKYIDTSGGLPTILRQDGTTLECSEPGQILGLGDTLLTKNSRVELQDRFGMVMRFRENSEISIPAFQELNGRHALQFSGKFLKTRFYTEDNFIIAGSSCGGKSPTSCWVPCGASVVIEELNDLDEIYYVMHGAMPIWEYDEDFEKFDIVHVPDRHKVILKADPSKPMRERYTVAMLEPISKDDWGYLNDQYLNTGNWI